MAVKIAARIITREIEQSVLACGATRNNHGAHRRDGVVTAAGGAPPREGGGGQARLRVVGVAVPNGRAGDTDRVGTPPDSVRLWLDAAGEGGARSP